MGVGWGFFAADFHRDTVDPHAAGRCRQQGLQHWNIAVAGIGGQAGRRGIRARGGRRVVTAGVRGRRLGNPAAADADAVNGNVDARTVDQGEHQRDPVVLVERPLADLVGTGYDQYFAR